MSRNKRLLDLVDLLHRASTLSSELEAYYEEIDSDDAEEMIEHLQDIYQLAETAGLIDDLENTITKKG
jgi:hypothetical protein